VPERARPLSFEGAVAAASAFAALIAFVVLAGLKIDLPGIYYDELFHVTDALAFVKGGLGSDVAWLPGTQITLSGHPLPLMAHNYIGAVKTIAYVPVAALFGSSVESVRWFTVVIAALALVTYARFVFVVFGRGAAVAVATLLLATDPSYVFYSRIDLGPSVFMFLLKAVALWQLAVWWKTRNRRSLVLGAFALGVGVYDKTNFAWIVIAIFVAALVVNWRGVLDRLDRRSSLIGAGAFAVGCLPLIVYNVSWPPRTLEPALSGTLHLQGGNDESGPVLQVYHRFRELADLLDGRTISHLLGQLDGGAPLLPIFALAAALGILLLSRGHVAAGASRFVVACGVVILLAAAVTPGGSYPHHVLLAYPFPHLAIGAFAMLLLERGGRRWRLVACSAIAAGVLAVVAVNVTTTGRILARLSDTGGHANFTDAVYRLDDHLLRNSGAPFLAVDWGIFQNLVALSEGRLHGDELWLELNHDKVDASRYAARLTDPHVRYILHATGATNFPRSRANFFRVVRETGHTARLVARFRTRDRQPALEVYRVS
jgi:hypothetical protein